VVRQERSEEAIRDAFKPILSVSTDKVDGEYVPNGKYPPSFRAKVPVYDNRVSTEIAQASRNPVTYVTPESLTSIFPKGVEANLVVSGSIYAIAGGGFGVTWRLTAAQQFPRFAGTAAQMFHDRRAFTAVEDEETPDSGSGSCSENDEDEGYGGQAQSESAPAPAPAPTSAARSRRKPAGAGAP